MGAISEYVRCMEGSRRSIHPTHSCACYGYKQDWYVQGHEHDRTPVGKNSPFHKLYEDDGKVLMLGCGIGRNTSFHGIEEEYGCGYVLTEEQFPYTIVLPDKTYKVDMYRHNFAAHGYLLDAPAMWKAALDALKKDELYFVDKREGGWIGNE